MLPASPAARSRSAVLALASVLALAACSGGEARTGTASAPTTATAPTADASATSSPSGSPAPATPTTVPGETAGATPTAPGPAADPSPAAPGLCSLPGLGLEAAPAQGAAGSVIVTVTLTNDGDAPCTLHGYPGVSFVDDAGAMIGAPAERTPGAGGKTLVLAPGRSATASLRISQADNHSGCAPRPAAGLRIYPPENTESVVVPFTARACADPAVQQLEIQAFGA